MKLKTKMFSSMALVCALFSAALTTALVGMEDTAKKFNTFIEEDQAFLSAATTLYAQGLQMGQALRNIVLDPGKAQAYKNMEDAAEGFAQAHRAAQRIVRSDPEMVSTLQRIEQLRKKQSIVQQEIIALAKSNNAAAIAALNHAETPVWREIRADVLKLVKKQDSAVKSAKIELAQKTSERLLFSLTLAGFALVTGGAIAFSLARNVMKQLGGEPAYAVDIASGIAAGDLTAKIFLDHDSQNSLLSAMKTMQEGLAGLIADVRLSTDTIANASVEIASGTLDLSGRTEEQASALEETASSLEELTSTVKQNADNAEQANQLARTASEIAVKGGQMVQNVVGTMGCISDSASKIADIISVIDGIAFQTNILALNAAVEAARAGEQGRGFAVVASEVRNLAQRSAEAAKEIKALIEDSAAKVEVGNRLVNDAGVTMKELVASVERVAGIMAEISEASREQSTGIEQVNQAVMQMDQVTQQNAALVEESAAAAEAMQNQAKYLSDVASTFRLNEKILKRQTISEK